MNARIWALHGAALLLVAALVLFTAVRFAPGLDVLLALTATMVGTVIVILVVIHRVLYNFPLSAVVTMGTFGGSILAAGALHIAAPALRSTLGSALILLSILAILAWTRLARDQVI